jgi:23S rRNA maturation mini-RNase III
MVNKTRDILKPIMVAIANERPEEEIIKLALEAKLELSKRLNYLQKYYTLIEALIGLCNIDEDNKKIEEFYSQKFSLYERLQT